MLQRALQRLQIEGHAIRVIRMFFLIPGIFFFLVGYMNVLIQTPDATEALYTSAYVDEVTTTGGTRRYGINGENVQTTLSRSLMHEYSTAKTGAYIPVIVMRQHPSFVTVESQRSLNRLANSGDVLRVLDVL